ncbi:MAG: winged helix-turn-helix transcriptional regulator [Phycisphaerales bacterium]|nr:MAG: winged helix-turn-helix transcriptional regulator [Phycisphaerales bacterium]
MDEKTAQRIGEVLKGLAHPLRLRIVDALQKGEMCVGDVASILGERQAVTSQHLNTMRDKGVLASRRDGSRVYYRIRNSSAVKLLHCFATTPRTKKRSREGLN